MGGKITHAGRAELTNAVRRRYGAATGAEKRKILDECVHRSMTDAIPG